MLSWDWVCLLGGAYRRYLSGGRFGLQRVGLGPASVDSFEERSGFHNHPCYRGGGDLVVVACRSCRERETPAVDQLKQGLGGHEAACPCGCQVVDMDTHAHRRLTRAKVPGEGVDGGFLE